MTAQPIEQEQPEQPRIGGPELTIVEHLVELRNRVIKAGLAVILGVILCFVFWEYIFDILMEPARSDPDLGEDFRLAQFALTDGVFAVFRIGLYGGVLLASPIVLYQIMAFVVPGLTPGERKVVLFGLLGGMFFLIAGMLFAYYVILPQAVGFLVGFTSDQTEPVIGIKEYIDFVSRFIFFVGIAFELPMVIALLARLGMVTARQLIGFWRYAIVLVFVVAAIVTPTPDPLTQSMVAVPLMALYCLGILFAWFLHRPRGDLPAPGAST